MKIIISNESANAHFYERQGLAKAFAHSGHQVAFWDIRGKSAFDIFDEVEPDIFIGQAYNLDRATIKCIQARPHLRVGLKAGDFGPFYDDWTEQKHQEYPILMASKQEKESVFKLRDSGSIDFVFIHYHPDYIGQTHGYWEKEHVRAISLMNAADVFDYTNGQYLGDFASDIAFVGGKWGYKSRTLDRYILPLCNSNVKLNVKIFGNSSWGIPQYCGFIDTQYVKHIFASAKICPSISEPHSQEFGFDIIERPFKLMSNKAFVISDYVEGLRKLYNEDELVLAKTPEEFIHEVEYYLTYPDRRQSFVEAGYKKTIEQHTYFERAKTIFNALGLDASSIEFGKQRVIQELNL
jgi:hypothetical protein